MGHSLGFGYLKGHKRWPYKLKYTLFFFFSTLFDNVDAEFHEWYLREANMFLDSFNEDIMKREWFGCMLINKIKNLGKNEEHYNTYINIPS
jgi:hypothetical protein